MSFVTDQLKLSKQLYFNGYNKQPEFEKFINIKIKKNIDKKKINFKLWKINYQYTTQQ